MAYDWDEHFRTVEAIDECARTYIRTTLTTTEPGSGKYECPRGYRIHSVIRATEIRPGDGGIEVLLEAM